MFISIITPEKTLYSGDAEMLTAPGTLGEFGVLIGHAPFISTLKPGVITIELSGQQKQRFAVLSGIAEVTPEGCIILAETAQDCSTFTQADAQAKLQDAKKLLDDAITDEQKKWAGQQLALAEAVVAGL